MIEKIKRLEEIALRLEPCADDRSILTTKIIDYSENFLQNIDNLPSYKVTDHKGKAIYDSPVREEAGDIDELLHLLKENVDTPGLNPASKGHLGYIPGGGIFHSSLGDYLAAITNRYAGVFFASPGAVYMENMLLEWMSGIIGYPNTSGGNLTSGGSIANLMGIVTARDAFHLKAKELDKTVIYLSEQVHHSIDKAIRIAGLNECIKRYIPLGQCYRIKSQELENIICSDRKAGLNPWLIVASAGTTDVGAVDPINEISSIAENYKLWLHVDAAYGGFFILCDSGKAVLQGLNKSDSIVMDPHKGMFIPYGSGAVLVKDKMQLLESHHYQANYMQDALTSTDEFSPGDLSPELSKHFRGERLWLPLKIIGLAPFRAALEEKIQLARYFYDKLQAIEGIELGPYPELSVVTFRIIPKYGDANEFNKQVVNEIQQDGKVFLSSTMLDGKFIIRLAVLSFRTHLDTIDLTIDILRNKIEKLK
jgi:aromatic-L-amino-acid/L-tryptophan decarboxylase